VTDIAGLERRATDFTAYAASHSTMRPTHVATRPAHPPIDPPAHTYTLCTDATHDINAESQF